MRLRMTMLGMLAALLLAACGTPEGIITVRNARFNAIEIQRGGELYRQHCASCHGVNGEGQFPEAPLEPDATGRYGAPPHDETGHTWHHSDELLVRYILEGGFADPNRFYTMPSWSGTVTEDQAMMIIAYIKTLWTDEQRENQQMVTEEEQRMMSGG